MDYEKERKEGTCGQLWSMTCNPNVRICWFLAGGQEPAPGRRSFSVDGVNYKSGLSALSRVLLTPRCWSGIVREYEVTILYTRRGLNFSVCSNYVIEEWILDGWRRPESGKREERRECVGSGVSLSLNPSEWPLGENRKLGRKWARQRKVRRANKLLHTVFRAYCAPHSTCWHTPLRMNFATKKKYVKFMGIGVFFCCVVQYWISFQIQKDKLVPVYVKYLLPKN